MPWSDLPETSTFEPARRREAYRRFGRAVTGGRQSATLKDLDEVRERLRLFDQTYQGLMPIEVANIVGTAGRNMEFDKNFLPRRHEVQERWRRLELAYPDGGFPPIIVYKLHDMYFVVDGHHCARDRQAKESRLHRRRSYRAASQAPSSRRTRSGPNHLCGTGAHLPRGEWASGGSPRREDRIQQARRLSRVTRAHSDVRLQTDDGASRGHLSTCCRRALAQEHLHARHRGDPKREPARDLSAATEADLYLLVHQRRLALFPERGYVSMEDMARELKERGTSQPVRRAVRRMTGSADQ